MCKNLKKLIVLSIWVLLVPTFIMAQYIGTGSSAFHNIISKSNGDVYTWGYNEFGQLGIGNNESSNIIPAEVDLLHGKIITQVAMGSGHTIALDASGVVYTWGQNRYGELGIGNENNVGSNIPVEVGGVLSQKTIIQVAAGEYFSIALGADGTVYTWGYNYMGQLGNGNYTDSNIPVETTLSGTISGGTIIQVAAGRYHSMALADDGTIYTWGFNGYRQLGNGTDVSTYNYPVPVFTSGALNGKTVIQIAAGNGHSMALTTEGNVYTWGWGGYGQLGNEDSTRANQNVPVAVSTSGVLSGKTITKIAGGGIHSVALASDGTVYTWGQNSFGELGNGDNLHQNQNVPVAVVTSGALNGVSITQVAAGNNHTIALGNNGGVYTWGRNQYGVLGNGSYAESNVPVAINQSGTGLLPVEIDSQLPTEYKLSQNYPNPFNPSTTIKFEIPEDSQVKLELFNVLGEKIATLIDKEMTAGSHNYQFSISNYQLPSGIYLYQLQAGSFREIKKMMLVK